MAYSKLEKDGKVAVLVSPEFGAGWSTWNGECAEAITFDADIASAVLAGDKDDVFSIAERKYPDAYKGGIESLVVYWVKKGEAFEITEYDGSESLKIIGEQRYLVA